METFLKFRSVVARTCSMDSNLDLLPLVERRIRRLTSMGC